MSWIFEANSADRNKQAMFKEVVAHRRAQEFHERQIAMSMGLAANAAAVIPQDVWREMDSQTKMILRNDEGDNLLSDLLPLAKTLPIGKIIHQQRRASDAGIVKRSVSGQVPELLDKTNYNFGKTVVPVFRAGYGREWREVEGQRSEAFDGLIDDNANVVRAVRRDWATYIRSGDAGVVFDGETGYGFANSPDVVSYNIGAGGQNINYTSSVVTGEVIRNGFIAIRDALRISNNVNGMLTVYVSREIMSNLERYFNDNFVETILQQLLKLTGIAAIKETALLSGNEMFWTQLSSESIRPLVGMAINTIALPRQTQLDNYNFVVWGAMGIEFQADYNGNKSNLFASDLG